jgi:hypothetical protein
MKPQQPVLPKRDACVNSSEVVPVDKDGDLEDEDMGMPMFHSLKIMMKHHGKS